MLPRARVLCSLTDAGNDSWAMGDAGDFDLDRVRDLDRDRLRPGVPMVFGNSNTTDS